jgi:hypothetical protein
MSSTKRNDEYRARYVDNPVKASTQMKALAKIIRLGIQFVCFQRLVDNAHDCLPS